MLYQELAYDRVVSRVRGIQFCVMSEQEIRRRSVCEVLENQTFSGNEPVPDGLFDTRMGVIDNNRVCGTCHQRNTFCPGHFGHVMLARPVFYVQFFDIVRKLLQCVCFRCSKCLVNLDSPEVRAIMSRKGLSRQKRWEAVSKLCQRIRRCGQDTVDGCGAKKPDKVMKTDDMRIEMQWRDIGSETGPSLSDDAGAAAGEAGEAGEDTVGGGAGAAAGSSGRKKIFTAEDVLRILRRISDEDAVALGFDPRYNRPEWMVCTVLPVPPPSVRPSVRQETGQRQEDDLTHKLGEIVKTNNMVRSRIAKGSSYDTVEHWVNLLQYHVATLIDNALPSMYPTKDRAGRNFRSLCERLKHKEGRIRGNLMGKRVDFSARTVITPDPNLSIDELGVPLKIAMNLTFPEVVNEHNIEELRGLVCAGPDTYPGAKHVRKTHNGNRTIRLRGHPDLCGIELEPGDVVERHLRNGDYVLFNRQPSLHKMSMMAHRVRVMEYNTFRLNVCVCACYNADFDGDEMNMHVPQSLQTHHELKELAAVPLHVVSPRYSKPIITIVQDVALGVYRITQKDVRISQRQLFNLVATNPLVDPGMLPAPTEPGRWSGRLALSTVLPPSVSVRMASGDRDAPDYDPDNDEVIINNGVITSGVLNTTVYAKESRGLVHATYNSLGPDAVVAMLDGTQKLICDWLVLSGFSVGVSDLMLPNNAVKKMAAALAEAKANAYATIRKVHAGTFENVSTKSDADYLEDQIDAALIKGMDAAEKVSKAGFPARSGNRMLNMIDSGSKGKSFNFTQMVACLGPQSIEQKRVPDGFDHRTLPHYTKYDDGPEARGFVEHSFIQGLAPHEFFFHSMAGRIGLIDTAVRSVTWETPIVIVEHGAPKYVLIGEWIDALLLGAPTSAVQRFPEDRDLELLELPVGVFIPTVDAAGDVTWGSLTAVTRHDPGERLYKVTTVNGREVTVAESKSLLVWDADAEAFVEKDSSEVVIGDFLPVVARLPEPPVAVDHIDVADFLVLPTNRCEAFTRPFHEKVETLMDGCSMPDRFALDRRNGMFVGLFLTADGHVCEESGIVSITSNDAVVRQFAKDWLEGQGFVPELQTDTTALGTSYTLACKSTLLASFLGRLVGHDGAHNKHVPDIAFVAPLDFVRGLLNGYFSDGWMVRGGLSSCTRYARLNDGIAMLCACLGAFCEISVRSHVVMSNTGTLDVVPMHQVFVGEPWARALAGELGDLLHPTKDAALKSEISFPNGANQLPHANACAQRSDVVLDPVKNIEVLSVEGQPKLYDVTVPSTLNFVLANGLGCRDTSETGYIQRKLVKAMEDCKIHPDLTVRNASGHVVQFLYGEDGMDAVKLEFQKMPYLSTSPADMRAPYLLSAASELRGVLREELITAMEASEDAWRPRLRAHFEQLVSDRRQVITGICGGLDDDKPVVYPVNVGRIVLSAADVYAEVGCASLSDAEPAWILDHIDKLCAELHIGAESQSVGVRWMPVLLRCFLSPKVLLLKHRLSRLAIERVVQQVRSTFFAAIAAPSEMVGIVAAQSIGEPTTQLSCLKTSRLLVQSSGGCCYGGEIGAFVDRLLEEHSSDVVDLGGDSVVLDMRGIRMRGSEDFYVVGVSDNEKTSWNRISQISRHPANGGMVRVRTKSGRTTCATLSHSFLRRTESGIVPVLGSDLKVGDRLPVTRIIPTVAEPKTTVRIGEDDYALTRQLGRFFGECLADGCVGDDRIVDSHEVSRMFCEHGMSGKHDKRVPGWMFTAGPDFVRGVLGGYFDSIGNIDGDSETPRIRTSSSTNVGLADDMALLLARVGVFAIRRREDDGFHTVEVSARNARVFREQVGPLTVKSKADALDRIVTFAEQQLPSSLQEEIDLIPELGDAIAFVSQRLALPDPTGGHKDAAISREMLLQTVAAFEAVATRSSFVDGPFEKSKAGIDTLACLLEGAEMGGVRRACEIAVDATLQEGDADWAKNRDDLRRLLVAFGKVNDARRVRAIETLAKVHHKLAVMRQAAESDVVWDQITELQYLPDPGEYVYDLTVPGNDSFMVDCGVLVHNTLNTFHFSGAATASAVTAGVPRMRELMSMSKTIKTPAMTIRLRPEWAASMERANEVASNVQTTCFRDLVKSSSVYFDPSDAETTIDDDRDMMKFYREFGALDRMGCDATSSPWLLRFELDRAKMLDLKVTMLDVEHVLTKFYADTVTCMLSDDNADRLVCRLRISATSSDEDLLTEIKALEQSIIETSVVKGVAGIHKAVLGPPNKGLRRFDATTDAFVVDDEWTIVTAGSNLMDVIRNDRVDYTRTTTNDVYEVYNVLGVEAARQVLIDELRNVLRDLPLDHRHLSLLVDTMSNRGFFMSIDRHGINHRGELGPLAKCSFEETTDMLIKAGVFAERDRINGVSANIMLGQVAPCGTGDCEVLVDGERLSRFAAAVPLQIVTEERGQKPRKNNNGWGKERDDKNDEPPRVGPVLPALALPDTSTAMEAKDADELEIV